jgi:4'-phosphopantetheinyl transferase
MYKIFIKKNTDSNKMLNNILKKYHINNDIFYNEYGKPYIKNNPLYFNISHSNNITVIAISDKEIGIDIEHITFKKNIIDKICTEEEKLLINNAHGFTKLWVKKESYIKYLGTGLSYGLKNVDTNKLKFIIKKYKNYYISIYN